MIGQLSGGSDAVASPSPAAGSLVARGSRAGGAESTGVALWRAQCATSRGPGGLHHGGRCARQATVLPLWRLSSAALPSLSVALYRERPLQERDVKQVRQV
jgi:hypothetical protein